MSRRRACAVLAVMIAILAALAFPLLATAATVTLTGNVLPNDTSTFSGGTAPTVAGTGASATPYVYTFAAGDSLNMGAYYFYSNDLANKNTRLVLSGGGDLIGTQTATAFDMKAIAGSVLSANLDIQGANNIQIGKVWTYHTYWEGTTGTVTAGHVTIGTNTTDGRVNKVEIAEIDTHGGIKSPGAYQSNAGSVTIYGKSDVLIWDGATAGDVRAYEKAANSQSYAGTVKIYHQGAFLANDVLTYLEDSQWWAAGAIDLNGNILGGAVPVTRTFQVNKLDAHYSPVSANKYVASPVTVQGYGHITIADGVYAYNSLVYTAAGAGGAIKVTGTGNISVGAGGLLS